METKTKKVYWIVYGKVSRKYPNYTAKQKHYVTNYVLNKK